MSDTIKGLSVARLHYTADPEKATPEWKAYAKAGQSEAKFQREYEMDPRAGALTAVFREAYRPSDHERALDPHGMRVFHSFDFGRGFPVRVWFSRTAYNGLRVYASMYGQSISLRSFCEQTIAFEVNTWGEVISGERCFCDPAGNQHKDDGLKSIEVLRTFGWLPRWRGSRIEEGIEALSALMLSTQPDGAPAFLVDPRYNSDLCAALRGAYKRNRQGAPEHLHPHGDLVDALRYGAINTMPRKGARRPQEPPFYRNPISGYGMAIPPHARATFDEVPL